jgi:ribosome-interacting GTPase 1
MSIYLFKFDVLRALLVVNQINIEGNITTTLAKSKQIATNLFSMSVESQRNERNLLGSITEKFGVIRPYLKALPDENQGAMMLKRGYDGERCKSGGGDRMEARREMRIRIGGTR